MKIYIVTAGYSDYDDERRYNLKAYVNEAAAEKHVAEIEAEIKRIKGLDPQPVRDAKGYVIRLAKEDTAKVSRFEVDYESYYKSHPIPDGYDRIVREAIGKAGYYVQTYKREAGKPANNLVAKEFVEVDLTRLKQLLAPELGVNAKILYHYFGVDEIELA